MRTLMLLIPLALYLNCFLPQGDNGYKGSSQIKADRVITGTLIDIPVKLPDCGVFCYVVACRLKESITNKTVILFIPCPELYGKDFFKKDRLYEAHLLPDESKYKDCVKSNRFQGQKAPLYYVDDIKKMENK